MRTFAAFVAAGSTAVVLTSASPALAASTAQVVVVHGLRGLVADVQVDGKQVLQSFAPARVTDPLSLPPGKHRIVVFRDTNGQPAGTAVLDTTVSLPAGTTTAAVGLTGAGSPSLFGYSDAASQPSPGRAELVVRNIAAGPTVSVGGTGGAAQPVPNGGQMQTSAAAGTAAVDVRAPNGQLLLPPQHLPLAAGEVTTLYLTGSQSAGTLAWLATSRPASSVGLRVVPTGDGSVFGERSHAASGQLPLLAAAVCTAAGLGLWRRRTVAVRR